MPDAYPYPYLECNVREAVAAGLPPAVGWLVGKNEKVGSRDGGVSCEWKETKGGRGRVQLLGKKKEKKKKSQTM